METRIDETQNTKQYLFRTDNNLTTSAQRSGGLANTRYQEFIWQKPKNISKVYITAIAGGGSGGNGGTNLVDGFGGGSGSVSHLLIDADQLPDYLTVRTGYGGDVAYAPNTFLQLSPTSPTSAVYKHPNNAFNAAVYVTNVSVLANKSYKIEAWGGGAGGAGYNILATMTNKYTYGGGGGGYAAVIDFIPPSNGTITIRIPTRENPYFTPGPDTLVLWSNSTVSNVELLFAGGGKVGALDGVAVPGVGGSARANTSIAVTTYTANGGNASFLTTTDPTGNYLYGSGGGGAGGSWSNTNNESTSRKGANSQINGMQGGAAGNGLGNGGSPTTAADGFGGAGGGASGGVPMTTSYTGKNGGNGAFPGGGGGTGFYWRGLGNGGAGAPGCVRIITSQLVLVDVTPTTSAQYNNGSNTVVYCGDPSANVILLKAIGGSSGYYTTDLPANGAIAKSESRGSKIGLTSFYNGSVLGGDSVGYSNSIFLSNNIVSSGVSGSKNYQVSLFSTTTNTSPSSTETYQSMIESISPLFSSGGFGAQKALATGGSGGFGSGGGGGIGTRNTYPYGGPGGKGGSGIVLITCW